MNVQDVVKLVLRCASEFCYVCTVYICCLELRNNVVYPSTLIDMLTVKTSRSDSPRTTLRAPMGDPKIGQGGCPRPREGQDCTLPM